MIDTPLKTNREIKNLVFDVIILLLFMIVFFGKTLFLDKFNLFCSDYIVLFVFHNHTASLLKLGLLPFWEPFMFGPFAAVLMPAIFYPLNLLMDFFMSRASDISHSFYFFNYQQIFHLFLASFFMYLLMKNLGLKRLSSLFSGILFAYSGSLVSEIVHPCRLNACVWLPIIFLFLIKANEKNWKYSLIAGLFLGISFLGGALQKPIMICLILLLYSLYSSYSLFKLKAPLKSSLAPFRNCVIAFLVALGISAIQIVPTLEYAALSGRANSNFDKMLTLGNTSPAYLIHFLISDFFTSKSTGIWWGVKFVDNIGWWEANFYIGVISLIFMLLAILSPLKKYTKFFFGLLLLSIFLMLGKHTILSGWFFLLPGLGNARFAARYVFIANFSMAFLAGLGVDTLMRPFSEHQHKYFTLITKALIKIAKSIALISLPIFYIMLFLFKDTNNCGLIAETAKAVLLFAVFFVVSVAFLIFIRKVDAKVRRWLLCLMVLLAVFDLFLFQMPFNPIGASIRPDIWAAENGEIIDYLRKDKEIFRVSGLEDYKAIYDKISVAGFAHVSSFGILRQIEFIDLVYQDINSPLFDLYNMKYVVDDKGIIQKEADKFQKVEGVPNLYENKMVMPRAFVVHKYKVIKGRRQILEELKVFDPREYIILEEKPSFIKVTPNPNSDSIATINKYSYFTGEVEVDAKMVSDGFLFISEVWYPGWEAYVDGIKTKIYHANYAFRAVELSKGEHIVNFRYNPVIFKIGGSITLFTILSLIVIIAIRRNPKK